MKEQIKLWLDANVWDGEDRSGCLGDSASFNPDQLQELVEECFEDISSWNLPEIKPQVNPSVIGGVRSNKVLVEYVFDGNIFISEGYYFENNEAIGWANTFDDIILPIRWKELLL